MSLQENEREEPPVRSVKESIGLGEQKVQSARMEKQWSDKGLEKR